ncbi:MAG: hypothetical protein LBC19_09905 [Tannerella sp.]|jgi:YVTN family beta-propeller protein|nr:hypothetical protein [Tannerella sp.]
MKKSIELLKVIFCYLVFVYAFSACEEEDPLPATGPVIPGSHGVFILNEGTMKGNDAGLSCYNFETGELTPDLMNGELGDLAQDMMAYGSKLYIAMSGSSNITVLDMATRQLLKRISVMNGDKPREPRYLTAYEGKIYASTYDGNVVRLDTATLTLDNAVAKVGNNPDGIVAVNGKLYVANSGGMQESPDSTLSVVDVASFQEERKITVGVNPYFVKAGKDGNIYLTYRGNYGDIPGGIQQLDTQTGAVTALNINANQKFDLSDDLLYFYNVTYDENWVSTAAFGVYNTVTGSLTSDPVISDGTVLSFPYAIQVNPKTKDVYIANADFQVKSKVYTFGTDGKMKTVFETGIGSNTFVFY